MLEIGIGDESFRVLRIYTGLKGIKSSALGDFWQLNKLLLFNYFQDVKIVKLNTLGLWFGQD